MPAASVAGRFAEGVGIACLQSSAEDWCMIESQNWVGSDIVRPDCTTDPVDPSCTGTSDTTNDQARIANLYSDTMLCSDCFIKMFQSRLSSDYLPDDDYSDYLVEQLQDIQDVCSKTIGAISTRYWAGYLDATIGSTTGNGTISATATTLSGTSLTTVTTTTTVVTPTPTQTGMALNCDSFYKAVTGDSCFSIAENTSIPLTDFETWNPAVGSNCTTLFAGYYYCIGITLDDASSACQMVDFSYGVTTKNPTGACNQMSQLWNVTTGDFLVYTDDPGCYSDTPLCLPRPCASARIYNSSTWYIDLILRLDQSC